MRVHPTAIIDDAAELDPTVEVGPYSIVHHDVRVGPGTRIGPYCVLHPGTRLGAENVLHANVSLGDVPQSIDFDPDTPSTLEIGDRNTFRESASVHRSEQPEGATRIGNDCFLMVHAHAGHDCVLGNDVVIASGTFLAGHVRIDDRVFLSANCLVHQFCVVGTLAFFRAQTGVSLDVPPFAMAAGPNTLRGLNSVGLRRAGVSVETRRALRRAYKTLFYSDLNMTQALDAMGAGPHDPLVDVLLDFVRTSERGCVRGRRPGRLAGPAVVDPASGDGDDA